MGGLSIAGAYKNSPTSSSAAVSSKRVRLHITPFTPALLDKIIAPSLKPLATNISFHTIQTFPEKDFGYIELPEMEAQKLKKKLNGSTLKGTKVKIEDAKSERKRKSDDEDEGEAEHADSHKKKARKMPRKQKGWPKGTGLPNDFSGHELGRGRHVKRGWSEATDNGLGSNDQAESGVKDEDEGADTALEGKRLRFKTTLPPTTSPVDTNSKSKKNKKDKLGNNQVVVEEFGKKRKLPQTPIRAEGPGFGALNYEDGKGWVDESGSVVEPTSSKKRGSEGSDQALERRISAIESRETADLLPPQQAVQSEEIDEDDNMVDETTATEAAITREPEEEKEVHPLEALFKRPTTRASASAKASPSKPRPKPIDTSFSFFDAEAAAGDVDMADGNMAPPQTPHTKRDLEWRSIRSAAPTPDTAAIGRSFSFPGFSGASDDEEVDEDVEGARMESMDGIEGGGGAIDVEKAESGGGEESAFRKWFYENRGDFNRGWKKRRRDEKKIERQRENRRVSRRVA